MKPDFTQKLDFHLQIIIVRVDKIDSYILKTFAMMIAEF